MKTAPFLKICGITSREGAEAAIDAGATWLGFNFHPPSPRYIAPEHARSIVDQLPLGIAAVGVFVNRPHPAEVQSIMDLAGMQIAQLHGDEDVAYCREVGSARVIKAFRAGPDFVPSQVLAYPVGWVLLDGYHPHLYGGTGRQVDWSVAAEVARLAPLFLAGGLSPETVGEAIRQVHPFALDVNSGVERAPGIKDAARLAQLREQIDLTVASAQEPTWENS